VEQLAEEVQLQVVEVQQPAGQPLEVVDLQPLEHPALQLLEHQDQLEVEEHMP
jgi:hypothetical protein